MQSSQALVSEQQQPTLLLVDDEQNILSALRRLLRPRGYNVVTAISAAEGLKILEQENVDLVISDMRMPEMDGAEFLERTASRWPDTMRILLTGYADINSTIEAINKGAIYKYISKPWDENDLILSVQHALEKKFLEQERRRLEALTQQQNEQLKEFNQNQSRRAHRRIATNHGGAGNCT
jgi:response regulator RpfG family c-di-GMP phosphodiesterase